MNRFRPLPERLFLVLGAIVLLVALPSFPGAQADPSDTLEAVEKRFDDAKERERALAREATTEETALATLRQRSVAIAARTQEHEATILELEERLAVLQDRQRQSAASLQARRRQLAGMLAALQRIAMHPPIALIALPTEPVDTVRSALLLRDTVPTVLVRASALRDDIEALSELTRAVAAAHARLETERAALEEQRAVLDRLAEEKAALVRTTREAHREAAERAARIGQEARDLRDLLARLATQRTRQRSAVRPRPPPAPPSDTKSGSSAPAVAALAPHPSSGLPVRGRVERGFGAPDKLGQPSKGITIASRPGSTVVAPRDGVVVFAGPFRGLGRLLIIEYEGKYHLLLAGLARIDTGVGEKVLAGEPVGTMEASDGADSALYMELRRNGQPINPLPWLAAGRTRVNG